MAIIYWQVVEAAVADNNISYCNKRGQVAQQWVTRELYRCCTLPRTDAEIWYLLNRRNGKIMIDSNHYELVKKFD